jgi:DNA-binding SARP family transcriptional activator
VALTLDRTAPPRALGDVRSVAGPLHLRLLSRFELVVDGTPRAVPGNVQRLIAFLALHPGPRQRSRVAGTLWMDTTEERAGANLRTALWHARRLDAALIRAEGSSLELGPRVTVDLDDLIDAARRLVAAPTAGDGPDLDPIALSEDLLPQWYDDWVLLERERLRQIRLHGLEALCLRLSHQRRFSLAIEAGLLAVAAEPLRESTHRALMTAHLAEGNVAEAVRQYDLFRVMLRENLGIEPDPSLRALVHPCR